MSSSADSQADAGSQDGGTTTEEDRTPVANYPIIPRNELELGEQLGAGAYGSVYRGIWKTCGKEITVAIKKVFMLEKEADILSKVRHRNIIQFFGVSQTHPDFFIVTEFAEGGSLYDYVHRDGGEIEFDQILNWAIQIAQGVSYLHYEAPETIIHRDLKSKNVVLSGDLICKLCDFGTSKNLTHSWTAPTWGGTAAWMSPEIINQKEGITTATDVWSYAVVLWEMISREVPYKGLTEFRIYSMIAQQGVTLVIPEKCPAALADLMNSCWKIDPKERCDMKQLVSALESMLANSEVTEQCGVFVKHKAEWKCEIEKQLKQLEEQKIDYARKLEELTKRERALRRREESQREAVAGAIPRNLEDDVAHWDEDEVCKWIRHISPLLPLTGELLDRLVALIIHHNITGSRLLDITPKDLEYLGICSLGLRVNLFREIKNLRKENQHLKNFPTLQVSQQLEEQKRLEKQSQALSLSLLVHVTMYTRQSGFEFLPKFRYKILVDTDWEDSFVSGDLPEDVRDVQSLVKDVSISLVHDTTDEMHELYRCTRIPFAMSDWIDSPVSGGEVGVICAITYTDKVIRPRNTCIRTKLFDFSRPQTLENKKVELTVKSYLLATNSPRRDSFVVNDRHQLKPSSSADSGVGSSNSALQGIWRSRATASGSLTPETAVDSISLIAPKINASKSPLWSDIAAGLVASPIIAATSQSSAPLSAQPNLGPSSTPDAMEAPIIPPLNADDLCQSVCAPQTPIRLPKPAIINPFFLPENLSRDSVIIPHSAGLNRNNKIPVEHTFCKAFRTYPRQQLGSRKTAGGNVARFRRRPLPIIIPPRRRFSTSFTREQIPYELFKEELEHQKLGHEVMLMNVTKTELLPQVQKSTQEVPQKEVREIGSLVKPMQDLVASAQETTSSPITGQNGADEDNEQPTEAGKKRRRRRRRPHKRSTGSNPDGGTNSASAQSLLLENQLEDADYLADPESTNEIADQGKQIQPQQI